MPIHASAVIDPSSTIHESVTIGPHVVIEGPVRIGPNCHIAASAVILGHTEIGAGCRIHSHAVIGDLPQDHAFKGEESYVHVGEGCTFREGVTIHCGTSPGSTTSIGNRCYLMTNSHVGHNCVLEDGVTLVTGAILGGYVEIGEKAMLSGNVAVHQFVRIGKLAMIGGLAKIVQDVPPFMMTNREGEVVGENRVGLIRAKCTADERKDIKAAFRIIYRSGLSRSAAIERLAQTITSDAGRVLLDFLSADSKRGMSRDSIRLRHAA